MGFIEDDSTKNERKIFTRENFNKDKFKEEDDIANIDESSNFHFQKLKKTK